MSRQSFRVSARGKRKIKEARNRKGWKISIDDPRPLQAASKFIIEEYAKVARIGDCDKPSLRACWSRNLEKIFWSKRQANREKIDRIKIELIKSTDSCLKTVERLVYEEEIYPTGISYGTWKRFCSQGKLQAIQESAFKAYSHILDLNWREIAEPVTKSAAKSVEEAEMNFPSQPLVYQNLVTRNYTKFIGREELKLLLQYLADDRIHRIGIEGVGGVGKTTLILEAAYLCLQAAQHSTNLPEFKAIVFTSAQQQRLKVRQILPCLQQEKSLEDIFVAIAETLNAPQILQGDLLTQLKNVTKCLQKFPTLLIFDNLETCANIEQILTFIYELPPTVKVITTSREQLLLEDFQTIFVAPLPELEATKLIEHHLQDKQLHLNFHQRQRLYQNTGGVPAAIVYALGQLSAGYCLESILPKMTLSDADFSRFYFERAIASVKDRPAYKLLMILAISITGVTYKAIAEVAKTNNTQILEAELASLKQLNLISVRQQQYQMLPLTRKYILTLLRNDLELERALRSEWINVSTGSLALYSKSASG